MNAGFLPEDGNKSRVFHFRTCVWYASRMRKDKETAIEMRKMGMSYKEIKSALNVPRSTLSDWFSKREWSDAIRKRLTASAQRGHAIHLVDLNKARGKHLAQAYELAREEARREFEFLKYDPLFISGIMLYWSEGVKGTKQGVKLTSNNPDMLRLYVEFLRGSCGIPIEKIRAYVLTYPEIEEKTSRAYWSKKTSLPWEQFTKSSVVAGRQAKWRLGWGVCTISVSSTYFKQKVLEWIKLLPGELLREEYYANISE